MDGVDFPKPAAAGELRGEAEIIHIAALGAGLEDAAVEIHGIGEFLLSWIVMLHGFSP